MRRAYHIWTAPDVRRIRQCAAEGLTMAQAAEAVGQPRSKVRSLAKREGIAFPYTKAKRQAANVGRDLAAARAAARKPREALAVKQLRRRLIQCHGPVRAERILSGKDPATNADIAAWRSLGQARAA